MYLYTGDHGMEEVGWFKVLSELKWKFLKWMLFTQWVAMQGVHYGRYMLIFIGCLLWL